MVVCAFVCSEGVVDIRIVVGEVENAKMEEQQAINFRRGKTRYVKLMPDLREAMRLGRRDFDSIHIWYLTARTGTYVVCERWGPLASVTVSDKDWSVAWPRLVGAGACLAFFAACPMASSARSLVHATLIASGALHDAVGAI